MFKRLGFLVSMEPGPESLAENCAQRLTAGNAKVDLRFSADASSTDVVNGDAGRLQQVIGNVLTNAVKFTPEGGRVDVSVEHAGSQME